VMLVDDRPDRRHFCIGVLQSARFRVVACDSAPNALWALRTMLPEAIVVSANQRDLVTGYVLTLANTATPIVPLRDRGETLIHELRMTFGRMLA